MSLLSQLLKESASAGATSAGGVANSRGTLFGGGKQAGNHTTMLRRMGFVEVGELPSQRKKQANTPKRKLFSGINEEVNTSGANVSPFDYQDVLSKLDQAVKTAGERKENVAVFGLEDDEGKIVKVYVDKEEAQKFEDTLAVMLADNNTVFADEDEPKTGQEIAEILYKLKDQFNIRDIEWGTIEGDEEEETEVGDGELGGMEGEADSGEDAEGLDGEEGLEGEDGELDPLADDAAGDDEAVASSALQSVIDMMKADSSARQAEAEARKSEADAIIAKNANAAAQSKVAKEEDLLDMQTAEKAKKDAKKEAETLAKLAKYKKEVGSAGDAVEIDGEDGAEDFDPDEDAADPDLDFDVEPNEENEEESAPEREMTKEQLAKLILKYAQAN